MNTNFAPWLKKKYAMRTIDDDFGSLCQAREGFVHSMTHGRHARVTVWSVQFLLPLSTPSPAPEELHFPCFPLTRTQISIQSMAVVCPPAQHSSTLADVHSLAQPLRLESHIWGKDPQMEVHKICHSDQFNYLFKGTSWKSCFRLLGSGAHSNAKGPSQEM